MKEIKFRAWNKGIKKMLFFDLNEVGSGADKGILYLRKQNIIMQFTGLKDKNGKEIFEGDIIKLFCGCITEVKFENAEFDAYSSITNLKKHLKCRVLVSWKTNCKVIGNKFENPELLEDKK